jgi:hypothetical protein
VRDTGTSSTGAGSDTDMIESNEIKRIKKGMKRNNEGKISKQARQVKRQ